MMVELVLIDDKTDEVFTTVELEQKIFDLLLKDAEKKGITIEDVILEAITEGLNNAIKGNKKRKRKASR